VILNFLILNCTRFYNSPGGGSSNNSSFSDVLNSLCNGLVNLTGGEHGTLSNLTASNSNVYTGLTSFLDTNDIAHTGYPKAYINWIFLDGQFNYVSSLSGSVLAASSTYPAGSLNMVAPGGPIALNKSGYLYIWVSNETTGWDVYYDNLSVQYKQGPLLEENHYYPFGLTMAGLSDKAIKTNYSVNKFRFNDGSELQNGEFADGTGLEMYDAGFRGFDPQLGRFTQADLLSIEFPSYGPYQFADGNPVYYSDPSGASRSVSSFESFADLWNYLANNQFDLSSLSLGSADVTTILNLDSKSGGGIGDITSSASTTAGGGVSINISYYVTGTGNPDDGTMTSVVNKTIMDP
jgi:RHS repeat-associated protein